AGLGETLETLVLADRDELHLRGDDALARVPELRDGMPPGGAPRPAPDGLGFHGEPVAALQGGAPRVGLREIPVVARVGGSSLAFLGVPTREDPRKPQGREPLADITVELRVAPRPARVVHDHGLV